MKAKARDRTILTVAAVRSAIGNWLSYTYTLYDLTGDSYIQIVWPSVPDGGQPFSPELGEVNIYGPTS
jgi:hypothetical protein